MLQPFGHGGTVMTHKSTLYFAIDTPLLRRKGGPDVGGAQVILHFMLCL